MWMLMHTLLSLKTEIFFPCWAFYLSIGELGNTHFFKTLCWGSLLTTKVKENAMLKLGSLVTPKHNGGWVFNLCILPSHPLYLSGKCFGHGLASLRSPKKINAKTSPFRTATPGHLNNTEKVIHKHNICVHMQVYFAAN